jgi:hypothetical protein
MPLIEVTANDRLGRKGESYASDSSALPSDVTRLSFALPHSPSQVLTE